MVDNTGKSVTNRDMSHQIAPEHRDLILDYLCDKLELSVSILDEHCLLYTSDAADE